MGLACFGTHQPAHRFQALLYEALVPGRQAWTCKSAACFDNLFVILCSPKLSKLLIAGCPIVSMGVLDPLEMLAGEESMGVLLDP